MRHPGEFELALFAGGDLGFFERWRVRKHLRECASCREGVSALEQGGDALRRLADEMPEGVNWARLSQEMTGNIRVGLAAGECVGPIPSQHRPRSLAWHAMAVLGAAFVIVLGALWFNMPRDQADHLVGALRSIGSGQQPAVKAAALPDSVVLEATPGSIELRAHGGTMSLLTTRSAVQGGPSDGVALSVSMQGSAGAQYVDSDTGQVTISRVYYAQ